MKLFPLLVLPVALSMIGCELQETKTQVVYKDNSFQEATPKEFSTKRLSTQSDFEYAALLARRGELLVTNPVAITHANDMFNDALKLDPTNKKALFYSAFTGIIMAFEGTVKRAESSFDKPSDYNNIMDYVKDNLKYPELVSFLSNKANKEDLKTYQDMKRFLQVEVVEAFETASGKLASINGDVNLILTQLENKMDHVEYDCVDVEDNMPDSDETYTYQECQMKSTQVSTQLYAAYTKTVDASDIKVLSSGLKGYSTIMKFMTAYSIEGQKHITNEITVKELGLKRALTEAETYQIVNRYPKYLTLENDNKMTEVVADLETITEVAMDLETLNNQFCDNESRTDNIIDSICFGAESRADMEKVMDFLSGAQEANLGKDINGNDVNIIVDLPAFLNNPVKDLKLVVDPVFDIEGKLTEQEPKVNGLFPNSDLLEKTKQVVSE
jgi:hypothetical protein